MPSPIDRPPPHFLGIGVAKCGTTWLDVMLRQHPDVWMPPIKELHFFDDHFRLARAGDQSRYFSRDVHSRNRWRRYMRSETLHALRHPTPANLFWAARFLFGRRTFNHYRRLFSPGRGKLCGEVTPDYAVLEAPAIQEIRDAFPDLRLVLMLRNPVERAWSHARMELAKRRGRAVEEVPGAEVERFLFDDEGVQTRGRYSRIICDWTGIFGERALEVVLFEDMASEPAAVLARVQRHIGVREVPLPDHVVGEVRHKGVEGSIPPSVRARLADRFAPEVMAVAGLLSRPGLTELWR